MFRFQDIYRRLMQIYSILSWHNQHTPHCFSHKLILFRLAAVMEGHGTNQLDPFYITTSRAHDLLPRISHSVNQEFTVLYFVCFTHYCLSNKTILSVKHMVLSVSSWYFYIMHYLLCLPCRISVFPVGR